MTLTEAREEARRRWGPTGNAWLILSWEPNPRIVGYRIERTAELVYMGWGPTWEEAFACADAVAAKKGGAS